MIAGNPFPVTPASYELRARRQLAPTTGKCVSFGLNYHSVLLHPVKFLFKAFDQFERE